MKSARTVIITAVLIFFLIFYLSFGRHQIKDTGPVSDNKTFSFLFFSDVQENPGDGDYSAFEKMLKDAVNSEEKPQLVIFGGDTVNDGGSAEEWEKFWNTARPHLKGVTTAAAVGNHDNYPLIFEQFDYPKQGNEGFFYSFDAGNIHFIVLDSNMMGAANEKDIEWLRNDLSSKEAGEAEWRIAVMHHPMWPPVGNPKDTQRAITMQENFLPLFEEFGVDLILCGHQHVYARSHKIGGITQIMAASGSKVPYSANILGFIAFSGLPPNYLAVTADGEKLNVTAYDGDGKPFDSYTLFSKKSGASHIRVIDSAGREAWNFAEKELDASWLFSGVFSTVNTWPSPRSYVAEGYSIPDILKRAGVWESAQTVSFIGEDGYKVSLTREQLSLREPPAIIAYRWREGTDDLGSLREDKPMLIFGQRDPAEQTNPAFVVGVSEIIVSDGPCYTWEPASTFPLPGPIARGETVKLQHPEYGLVKLHYTMDGSGPTPLSPVYNISAYQPELNVPIPINEPTIIKVLACGYGRNDSEIAEFEFTPVD